MGGLKIFGPRRAPYGDEVGLGGWELTKKNPIKVKTAHLMQN